MTAQDFLENNYTDMFNDSQSSFKGKLFIGLLSKLMDEYANFQINLMREEACAYRDELKNGNK